MFVNLNLVMIMMDLEMVSCMYVMLMLLESVE